MQVQHGAFFCKISGADIFFAAGIFNVKAIVAPALTGKVRRDVRTAGRDAQAIIKLHAVIHQTVKYARAVNVAQPTANVNDPDFHIAPPFCFS